MNSPMESLLEQMPPQAAPAGLGLRAFLSLLTGLLARAEIRYAAGRLTESCLAAESNPQAADLELMLEARDWHKLPAVWRGLREAGYRPIQARGIGSRRFGSKRCGAHAWAYSFAWFEGLSLRTARVDLACAPPQGTPAGWLRATRPWRRLPAGGLCLILLGPDGAGKSTLITGLSRALAPVFGGARLFHWRPGLALPIRDGGEGSGMNASPHSQPLRGALMSMAYLAGFYADFCLGHALRVRPTLARGGLVIFDRYFPDLLADPRRYRYGGPAWLPAALWSVLPGRGGLTLILTDRAEAIGARKAQLPVEEIRHLVARYRELAGALDHAHVVETAGGIERTLAAAAAVIVEHLARGFEERLG